MFAAEEFLYGRIRNEHTRRAYFIAGEVFFVVGRAARFGNCEYPGIDPTDTLSLVWHPQNMVSAEQFAAAYEAEFSKTFYLLLSHGVPRDTALEITQSAWTRGWERRGQLHTDECLSSWVKSIAINMFRTQMRQAISDEPITEENAGAWESRPERSRLADQVLKSCSKRDQQLLIDRFFMGYSDIEIAMRLRITHTAVRIRLLRAKRAARIRSSGHPSSNSDTNGSQSRLMNGAERGLTH